MRGNRDDRQSFPLSWNRPINIKMSRTWAFLLVCLQLCHCFLSTPLSFICRCQECHVPKAWDTLEHHDYKSCVTLSEFSSFYVYFVNHGKCKKIILKTSLPQIIILPTLNPNFRFFKLFLGLSTFLLMIQLSFPGASIQWRMQQICSYILLFLSLCYDEEDLILPAFGIACIGCSGFGDNDVRQPANERTFPLPPK